MTYAAMRSMDRSNETEMMKSLYPLCKWMLALVAALSAVPPASAEIRNRLVAIVNDQVITLHELDTRVRELTGYTPDELKEKSEQTYIETRRRVLDDLIDQKIALQKIKELEIKVEPREVDQAIEKVKEDNQLTQEGLLEKLKERGMTYESYRKSLQTELERAQLINYEVQSKIVLTEESIEKYYREHIDEFASSGKVRLGLIFLKQTDPADKNEARALQQKAQEILSAIQAGEDFGKLAKKFSSGPGAKEGGDLGVFKLSELDAELSKQIAGLSDGDVTKPIIRPDGIRIIKVVEKDREGVKSLDQVRSAIQSLLFREEVEKRYDAWLSDSRKKAYIKIIF